MPMSRGSSADVRPEEEAADSSVVSADDFQFPSAKYEIIAPPILAAKLRRRRGGGGGWGGTPAAKSSVCNTTE